jgi:hypothetical protein
MKAASAAVSASTLSRGPSAVRRHSTFGQNTHALRMYAVAPLDVLKSELRLSKVKHVGWRYLWKQMASCPSVDVARSLLNKRHVATLSSSGPANRRLVRALEDAAKDNGKDKFAFRLLSIPPLVYCAIWLKSSRHRTDKIVVVDTIVPQIRKLRRYPINDFLDLLRPHVATLSEQSGKIQNSRSLLPRGIRPRKSSF